MALSEQRNRAREVCLVADDDEFFRVALRSILLNKLGYSHVVEAGSLNEAMKQLSETGPIALAIFDLAMPDMESASSLRAVRQRFPGTQVAVVSASKRRSDILQALEAGAHGYVPKGLGAAELSRALQTIRDGLIYVPPHLADVSCPEEARRLDSFNSLNPGLEPARLPTGLTARQRDVLELLVLGLSNKEIARALNLGEGTVKVHMAALFRALGVTSRAAAAATGTQLSRRS